jgi:hypothetical protein
LRRVNTSHDKIGKGVLYIEMMAGEGGVGESVTGGPRMPHERQTRRTVLKMVGSGPGVGAVSAIPVTARPDELSHQLNTAQSTTQQYRDIETARADGYGAISPYVPGMGFHFADGPPFGTSLEEPGVTVYFTTGSYSPNPGDMHNPTRDDNLVLGAVEWLVPGDQTDDPPNIFNDEGSPRNLKVTEEEGWHFEETEEFTGLHAWVHRGNPAGVFHHTNPNIE